MPISTAMFQDASNDARKSLKDGRGRDANDLFMRSATMLLWYNLVLMAGVVAGLPFWLLTLVRPKRRATFWHRLGWTIDHQMNTASMVSKRPPIWIHALSVGEVISAEPIVERLRRCLPDQPLVFSVSTRTGMETARRLFIDKADLIFYYPYDLIWSVRRIVRCVNPRMVVVVETDIWPNFLFCLKRRGTTAVLVNTRLSEASFRGYRLVGRAFQSVLACLSAIGAQSRADAERFIRLGVPFEKLVVTGNVKYDQKSSDHPESEARLLRARMGFDPDRKIIVMGSTHRGEEIVLLEGFLKLRRKFKDLLLIVAPRDPARAAEIEKLFREGGLVTGYLSALHDGQMNHRCDALLVNTIGILRRLYAVAHIAFIGGSLVREGGHNPLEPASFGKPILFGPDMSDFAEVADKLEEGGAAARVRSGDEFVQMVETLIGDEHLRKHMGDQALVVFRTNRGAVQKTMNLIVQFLEGGADGISEKAL